MLLIWCIMFISKWSDSVHFITILCRLAMLISQVWSVNWTCNLTEDEPSSGCLRSLLSERGWTQEFTVCCCWSKSQELNRSVAAGVYLQEQNSRATGVLPGLRVKAWASRDRAELNRCYRVAEQQRGRVCRPVR